MANKNIPDLDAATTPLAGTEKFPLWDGAKTAWALVSALGPALKSYFDSVATTLTNKILTSPDINGGTLDGTVIGASSAAAAKVTELTTTGDINIGFPNYGKARWANGLGTLKWVAYNDSSGLDKFRLEDASGNVVMLAQQGGGVTFLGQLSGDTVKASSGTFNYAGGAGVIGQVVIQRGGISRGYVGTNASDELTLYNASASIGVSVTSFGLRSSGTMQVGVSGGFVASDGNGGITTTITTASLVGKTITIKDGIITGFI